MTLRTRPTTPADLDEFQALALTALDNNAVWLYRFPGAKTYPEDRVKYSRLRFAEYLDNVAAGAYYSEFVEIDEGGGPKVIAFSLWSLPESWRPSSDNGPGTFPPNPS